MQSARSASQPSRDCSSIDLVFFAGDAGPVSQSKISSFAYLPGIILILVATMPFAATKGLAERCSSSASCIPSCRALCTQPLSTLKRRVRRRRRAWRCSACQSHSPPDSSSEVVREAAAESWRKPAPPRLARQTDSLCPTVCAKRASRFSMAAGRVDLLNEKSAKSRPRFRTRRQDPEVKDCPIHGHFEDVMAMDTDFFKHLEQVFPAATFRPQRREAAHHGSSTIKTAAARADGRPDERCNMMCDPCSWRHQSGSCTSSAGKTSTGPRQLESRLAERQLSVQFSAASPRCRRISWMRFDIAHGRVSRRPGATRNRVLAGICLRKASARRDSLRVSQFDGIGNAANAHRRVGNLFDVKLQAIENLWNAGISIVPVVTIVNGVNNEQSAALSSSRSTIRERSPCFPSSRCRSPSRRKYFRQRRHAQRYNALSPGAASKIRQASENRSAIGSRFRSSHFYRLGDLVHGQTPSGANRVRLPPNAVSAWR